MVWQGAGQGDIPDTMWLTSGGREGLLIVRTGHPMLVSRFEVLGPSVVSSPQSLSYSKARAR